MFDMAGWSPCWLSPIVAAVIGLLVYAVASRSDAAAEKSVRDGLQQTARMLAMLAMLIACVGVFVMYDIVNVPGMHNSLGTQKCTLPGAGFTEKDCRYGCGVSDVTSMRVPT